MDVYQVFYFDRAEASKCISLENQKPNEDFFIDYTTRDSIFVTDSVYFDTKLTKLKNTNIIRTFWKINDTLVNEDSLAIWYKFNRLGDYTVNLVSK